nr:reverse transcriptase domain-containing protein [Tanacetum cinerariifolium]
MATITGNQVKKFVWDNIVCRFKLSGEIISDNRTQFKDNPFKDWCEKLNIKQRDALIRCTEVNQAKNDEELLLNLDILEERREKAVVREARNKAKMEKYYNTKVRSTSFRPGDYVYRSNETSHAKESEKLGPNWEGPYEVIEALGGRVYKLENRSTNVLPRTWNVQDLKKCYL